MKNLLKIPKKTLDEIFKWLEVKPKRISKKEFKKWNKNDLKINSENLKISKYNYNKIMGKIKNEIYHLEKYLNRSLRVWNLSEKDYIK